MQPSQQMLRFNTWKLFLLQRIRATKTYENSAYVTSIQTLEGHKKASRSQLLNFWLGIAVKSYLDA